jgi:beta-lactam-binding protein with PASTA domain
LRVESRNPICGEKIVTDAEGPKWKKLPRLLWGKGWIRYPAILLAIVVALFLLLVLTDRVIMPTVVHWGNVGVIPDLTDLSLDQAQEVLENKGLGLEVTSEVYDLAKPPGTILSQVPGPNSRVREGRSVKVVVSKGGKTVLVPKLQGVSMRQAELLLAHEDLELGDVGWVASDSFPQDVVIASTPSFDTPVPQGMSINLTVSLGLQPDSVEVPDLLGMNLQASRKRLREIGLQLGRIKSRSNDDFLPETILSQSPAAGLRVQRGTEINVEISTTE